MRGEYVVALDDDDVSARNAMVTIRERIMDFPNRPLIFRMSGHPTVGTVWKEKTLALGNVGTPCLVAPNDPSRLAQYTPRYGGDFDFIRDTCAFYPDGPVWREEVICEVRPHLNRR